MIPDEVPPEVRQKLLSPEIMLPPVLWLISKSADEVNGKRLNASRWHNNLNPGQAPPPRQANRKGGALQRSNGSV
jgi:hypothetical protein